MSKKVDKEAPEKDFEASLLMLLHTVTKQQNLLAYLVGKEKEPTLFKVDNETFDKLLKEARESLRQAIFYAVPEAIQGGEDV